MPKAPPPSLGQLIRDRMHRADLTQAELATAMRVTQMTVSNLVNSRYRITARTARGLATHLGETPEWWLAEQARVDLQREAAK